MAACIERSNSIFSAPSARGVSMNIALAALLRNELRMAANAARRSRFRWGALRDTRSGTETAQVPTFFFEDVQRIEKSGVFFSCVHAVSRIARPESRCSRANIGKSVRQPTGGAPSPDGERGSFVRPESVGGEGTRASASVFSFWVDRSATLLYTSTPPAQDKARVADQMMHK